MGHSSYSIKKIGTKKEAVKTPMLQLHLACLKQTALDEKIKYCSQMFVLLYIKNEGVILEDGKADSHVKKRTSRHVYFHALHNSAIIKCQSHSQRANFQVENG